MLGVIGLDDGFGDPAPRSTTMPLLLVPACGVGGRLKQVSEVARSPSNDALAPCNTPKSENIQLSLTFGSTGRILGLDLIPTQRWPVETSEKTAASPTNPCSLPNNSNDRGAASSGVRRGGHCSSSRATICKWRTSLGQCRSSFICRHDPYGRSWLRLRDRAWPLHARPTSQRDELRSGRRGSR